MNLSIGSEIVDIMGERGIKEEDVKEVISYAEENIKLICEDNEHFLGKKQIGNFVVYAEYAKADDGYEVLNVYSHRVLLIEMI